MTVQHLIDTLTNMVAHGLNPGAIVRAYNGDSEKLEDVSGFLTDSSTVEICTDDMGG